MSNAKVNFDLPTGIENLDITVNFTSKIYPVVAQEAVRVGATVESLAVPVSSIDAVSPVAIAQSVFLRPVLRSFEYGPEATAPSATATEVFLRQTFFLEETTVTPEAVVPTATVTSLIFVEGDPPTIITHTAPAEAVAPSATVTSLELS